MHFHVDPKEELSSSKQVFETINENSRDQDKDGDVEPRRNKRVRTKNLLVQIFLMYMLE